jgi:hypothetical protein
MDRGDIGVVQPGKETRLFTKALTGSLIVESTRRKNFDSYFTVEVFIMGTINHAHSTRTDFLDDAVVAQCFADQRKLTRRPSSHEDDLSPHPVSGKS